MLKLRSVFAVLILAVAASESLAAAEGGDYTIRSNPSEVRVMFAAEDAQGHRVTKLEPKDVAVIDNEQVIRRFRSFSAASETPLHVVILIDVSDSVSKQIDREFEIVKAFVGSDRWRTGDQLSIAVFSGTQASVLCSVDCHERQLSLNVTSAGSTTPLYDALITATGLLAQMRDSTSRSVIIVLSDGEDTNSIHGLGEAIAAAQSIEASVYAVSASPKHAGSGGQAILERIALETGGVASAPGYGTTAALNEVLEDLRQGFVLTYELLQSPSARHEVRVVPALNSKLRFRSRQGFIEKDAQR